MSTRSCSLRWTWPPHKEHAEWSAAGVWGARLMCWMLVSVPARRRGHPGQSRKGGGQEAPPGAIICWDWQAGCPSCACVFSSSSWYGYTGGVLGCPQGVAHLHCPQSCSCRLGCGCESLSWPASCHCAAEEIKRNSTMKSGLGTRNTTTWETRPSQLLWAQPRGSEHKQWRTWLEWWGTVINVANTAREGPGEHWPQKLYPVPTGRCQSQLFQTPWHFTCTGTSQWPVILLCNSF